MTLFQHIFEYIKAPQFLLSAIVISFCVKVYLLRVLIPQGFKTSPLNRPWLFLLGTLIGSMFGDIAWIIKLLREITLHSISYLTVLFSVRISWSFLILQYQSLSLLIESLGSKKFRLYISHKILSILSISLSCYFLYSAFFDSNTITEFERNFALKNSAFDNVPAEIFIMRYVVPFHLLIVLMIPSLIKALFTLRKSDIPKILKKQLTIFIVYLMIPYIFTETLQAMQLNFGGFLHTHLYPIVGTSTLLILYAIHYGIKYVIGLRFLNFESQVQTHRHFDFIDDFKDVLEQLSHASNISELSQITQLFFKNAFDIPRRKTMLYIRSLNQTTSNGFITDSARLESTIEHFMSSHNDKVCNYLQETKILIHDELAFSNFYEDHEARKIILSFLDHINADIFIPIYEHNKAIAYIVVDRHARSQEFYGNSEHDEMLIFSSYLGNSIHLLQHKNIDHLLHQEKKLKDQLYAKHQEINLYKESIRSFLHYAHKKEIGILFYKNRRFTFANKTAKELISFDVNEQEGHPIAKALKEIALQVEEYKSPQNALISYHHTEKLVLHAVPNIEHNNVIITLSHPDISDIINKQVDALKDPTLWDFLLYLETTQAGTIINNYIPSSHEQFLHLKIELLKASLTKEPILLDVPEDDVLSFVEILHQISLREQLHVIKLHQPHHSIDLGVALFGINPMLGFEQSQRPLFESLNNVGTLFIQNIHFVDLELQNHLAHYFKSGTYSIFKSDKRVSSNTRVICSSNQNIQALVHEGLFSKALAQELQSHYIGMPSLLTLPESEFFDLIDGFTQQIIKNDDFKSLFELTHTEKRKLSLQRPTSLLSLKKRIHQLMIEKSKKNNIYDETEFDTAYAVSDPILIEAARLGKHALRDQKIMTLLWNKFKNQNKIATFLGVNRSSVNRRCKEYNFQ